MITETDQVSQALDDAARRWPEDREPAKLLLHLVQEGHQAVLEQAEAVPLEDDAPTRLATLRATSRLRLSDCCVLLAGQTTHASVATFDERLADAAAQFGLAVRP